VRENETIVVDVDHPGTRCDPVRDIVGMALSGQADPDNQELPHPSLACEELDGASHELPVLVRRRDRVGNEPEQFPGGFEVSGPMAPAAEEGVMNSGRVRAGWAISPGVDHARLRQRAW